MSKTLSRRPWIRWIVLSVTMAGWGVAHAHTGFESETDVRIYKDRMEVTVRTTFAFAWRLLGDRTPADVGEAGQAAARPLLAKEAPGLYRVMAGGVPMQPKKADCRFELDQHAAFLLTYDRPGSWPLEFKAGFFRMLGALDEGKIRVFDLSDDPLRRDVEPLASKVIHAKDATFTITLRGMKAKP
jgi:hypothetical protein